MQKRALTPQPGCKYLYNGAQCGRYECVQTPSFHTYEWCSSTLLLVLASLLPSRDLLYFKTLDQIRFSSAYTFHSKCFLIAATSIMNRWPLHAYIGIQLWELNGHVSKMNWSPCYFRQCFTQVLVHLHLLECLLNVFLHQEVWGGQRWGENFERPSRTKLASKGEGILSISNPLTLGTLQTFAVRFAHSRKTTRDGY